MQRNATQCNNDKVGDHGDDYANQILIQHLVKKKRFM